MSPPPPSPAMESSAGRRQPSTSSSSMSSQQVSGFSNFSKAASDGYPYPSGSPDTSYRHRRQASSYSAPFSSQLSRSSTRSSGASFKAAARGVAGVFGTCFVPRVRKKAEAEQEREVSQVSRGSRSGGYSQGSRSAGFHVSTDSGTIRTSSSVLLPVQFLLIMILLWVKHRIDQHENP